MRIKDQAFIVGDFPLALTKRYPWVKVVSEEFFEDVVLNQTNEVIAFMTDLVLVTPGWLDRILFGFEDLDVVAIGPHFNLSQGLQSTAIDYDAKENFTKSELKRFAKRWRQTHNGFNKLDTLISSCWVTKKQLLNKSIVASSIETMTKNMLQDALRKDLKVAVANSVFVHLEGLQDQLETVEQTTIQATRDEDKQPDPLVSACLITKDEEDNLEDCLTSLIGVVDEIIVYDTGSTDSTKEIAVKYNAKVIDGYWDDDFARARNEALGFCKGQWILWLDADETLSGKTNRLRYKLLSINPPEAFQVEIENLLGSGVSSRSVHPATRLFQRKLGKWSGRVHEQVLHKNNGLLKGILLDEVRIIHTGYLDKVIKAKNKRQRNLRIAQAELEVCSNDKDKAIALVNVARSLFVLEQFEDSFKKCEEAIKISKSNMINTRLALRTGIECLVSLKRLDEAVDWCTKLRNLSNKPVLANIMEARVRALRQEYAQSLRLFEKIGEHEVDDDLFEYGSHMVAMAHAGVLSQLGRKNEAADVLLDALEHHNALDTHIGTLVELLYTADRSTTEIVDVLDVKLLPQWLAQITQLTSKPAAELLEGLWKRWPDELAIYAAAANFGSRFDILPAMDWSLRLRQKNLANACPLIAIANDLYTSLDQRLRAASIAAGSFGDERARNILLELLPQVPQEQTEELLKELALYCPAVFAEANN